MPPSRSVLRAENCCVELTKAEEDLFLPYMVLVPHRVMKGGAEYTDDFLFNRFKRFVARSELHDKEYTRVFSALSYYASLLTVSVMFSADLLKLLVAQLRGRAGRGATRSEA